MANKDFGIRQVHEFVMTGPDERNLANAGTDDLTGNEPSTDIFAGAREWVVKWFGPFFSAEQLPVRYSMGLYLLYVGNYPLFVSSSQNIVVAVARHLIYSGHKVIPIDLLGREVLHYAGMYRQPLTLKTGLLFEDNRVIHPAQHIGCYRRAAAALAYSHAMPCDKYARVAYEYEPLTLTNLGKNFPLKHQVRVEPVKGSVG